MVRLLWLWSCGVMELWSWEVGKYSITSSLHNFITPSLHNFITPSLHHLKQTRYN
ncbi:MAG: hypothetical protein IJA42_07970 [Bacteroidales bacterium]|nr:hypothetical protein [Bacteroidales bacterium]